MQGHGHPLVLPLARKATSANTFTVKTRPLSRGEIAHIHHVSVCNNTTDGKIAHVGVVRDEFPIYLETLVLTTKTYFYKVLLDIAIPTDYRVIVKLVTPTSGDMYYINIWGEVEELPQRG